MNRYGMKVILMLALAWPNFASAATEYVSATTEEATFSGVSDFDQAGYAIANVGDVNCDGVDDMLIGAPYQESDSGESDIGKVYLLYGAAGSSIITGDLDLSGAADAIFEGEQENAPYALSHAGYAVSGAGDVNADGCDDFLIGAPDHYNSDRGGASGAAYLLYGRSGASAWSGAYSLSDADIKWEGDTNDQLGKQVAGVGDVNGDGYDDVLLHAYGYSSSLSSYRRWMGKTYLMYGGTTAMRDANLTDEDGNETCAAEGTRATSCALFTGEAQDDVAGGSISHGDLNRDGYSDIVISAPGADKTYLIYGGMVKLAGNSLSQASAKFSGAGDTSCIGDVTGDGKLDLFMANSGFSSDSSKTYQGRGYLINGDRSTTRLKLKYSGNYVLSTSSIVKATFSGDAYDLAGHSISCGGDVDGDGADDVLIGAEAYSAYTSKTYLLYGGTLSGDVDLLSSSSVVSFTQESGWAQMGSDVDVTGDYNGDGLADLLMSAVQVYATAADGPGITYLYYGF